MLNRNLNNLLAPAVFAIFLVQSSSVFAAGIPKTVVACTANQCPGISAILEDNEKLTDQAIIFQTSDSPEFMRRYEKKFSDRDNGGWQHIEVNESAFVSTQPVIGFGGAFTDTAAMLYQQMPPALQKEFTNAYFSTQGIAYSLGRVPMASNDFSCRKDVDGKPVLVRILARPYSHFILMRTMLMIRSAISRYSPRMLISKFL